MQWEVVIGLEVHVQLTTQSKIFSGASTAFGAAANSQACAVDLALPGTLPVLNEQAVKNAIMFGLAIDADICRDSVFDRKNYFYPDLPKGYQTSQMDKPIVGPGVVEIRLEDGSTRDIRVHHAHLEEDAGKSLHEDFHGMSGIDLNRAGTPLIEIVSEPDMRSAEEAVAYLRKIHSIVTYLGISDGDMSQGSMRCDANVSVRRVGDPELGTRREIKNVNSIRSLGRAIAFEAQAQIDAIEAGNTIVMETRHWDEAKGVTATLRRKETVADYRYFPDPDLVEIVCERAWVDQLREGLPELPAAARERLVGAGAREDQAATMVGAGLVPAFDLAVGRGLDAEFTANALTNQVIAATRDLDGPITGDDGLSYLADALQLAADGDIALNKLESLITTGIEAGFATDARSTAESAGLIQVSDTGALQQMVDDVIARNPEVVEKIRGGAEKAIGALVGQVMGASKGQANPAMVNELLRASILGD